MKLEPRQIIRRALMTEKGTHTRQMGKTGNRYAFEVHPDANKIEIARAVEEIFGVKVANVRTMNYKGKLRRYGRFQGRTRHWKKAVVVLESDQTIDVFDQI